MPDDILVPDRSIVSLEEARAAKVPAPIGEAGLKRNASKEFVLETATQIALGACQRTYDAMSAQQAEGLAKVEAMCLQHVNALRAEIEARTVRGRWRQFVAWLKVDHPLPLWRDE